MPAVWEVVVADWADENSIPYSYLPNPQTLNLYSFTRNNPLAGCPFMRSMSGNSSARIGTRS